MSDHDLFIRRTVKLLLQAAWSEKYAERAELVLQASYWHRQALERQIADKQRLGERVPRGASDDLAA